MQKLSKEFYARADIATIAKELLGTILVTNFDGIYTSARIVETEAYAGIIDKASHAYSGRRTNRTEIMFGAGGKAYVYLCYGIHHLFNVVTNEPNKPDAVLIRGVEPLEGIDAMLQRMKKEKFDTAVGRGPGNVSKAMGLFTKHTGTDLQSDQLFLATDGTTYDDVMVSRRIGVDYAGTHAKWLYRFYIHNNPHVTKHLVNKEGIPVI
jgi:DNA-3-methyladenine glycosylase